MVKPLVNYKKYAPTAATTTTGGTWAASWDWHLANNGGRGGVDLVAAEGTAVRAPTDGTVHNFADPGGSSVSAGKSCHLEHDDNEGWSDVFSHLSSFALPDGRRVSRGTIIGYSGHTGNVAAHLHRHLEDPDGIRRNPINYFSEEDPMPTSFAKNYLTAQTITTDWRTMLYASSAPDRVISDGATYVSGTVHLTIDGLASTDRAYGRFIALEGSDIRSFGTVTFEGSDETASLYFETSINAALKDDETLRFQVKTTNSAASVSEYHVHALAW